jgi:hypothetical protein
MATLGGARVGQELPTAANSDIMTGPGVEAKRWGQLYGDVLSR